MGAALAFFSDRDRASIFSPAAMIGIPARPCHTHLQVLACHVHANKVSLPAVLLKSA